MNSKEPIRDCPELLSLAESAKLLGVSRRWLQDRAVDYGAVKVGRELRFFKDIVGSEVPQIVSLLAARLMEERRRYEEIQEQEWERGLAAAAQQRREEKQRRAERIHSLLKPKRCKALTVKETRCSQREFRGTGFCHRHKEWMQVKKNDPHKCEAPTKKGAPCPLPVVPDDSKYENLWRCRLHQHIHPSVVCPPIPPKKRSHWTPEMREAARNRAWKGNYQERFYRAEKQEDSDCV